MMFPKKKRCQAFRALRVDNSTSTITVNRSLPEHQTGDPDSFRYDIPLAHVGAAMVKVEITVAFGGQSQSRTVWLFAPPASETLEYDADGNLLSDARWT